MVNNIHDSCLHWEVGEAIVIKTMAIFIGMGGTVVINSLSHFH